MIGGYPQRSVAYFYNSLGERLNTASSHYVFDEKGRQVGEYALDGTPLEETVFIGNQPVAILKSLPQQAINVYYIYTDHLNTPRLITRALDDKIVWRWDVAEPFGASKPIENPSGLGAFVYNRRFPGQVFDEFLGVYYNYFRDFDPETGRYLQSDPIGLVGGINTYLYVGGNPLIGIDPFGLLQQCRTGLDKLNGYGTSTPLHHEYSCWTNKDGTRSCRGFGRDPNSGTFDAIFNRVPGKVLKDNENVSHGKQQCGPDDKNECMNKCVADFYQGLENDTSAYSWIRSSASQCQQMNQDIVTTCSQYCSAKK